jgi:glycosyltransferase involved in cell wall biosynthesis
MCEFHGVIQTGQPVLEWLDDVDIYVQPSLTEGLPRSLVEAMSRGCPIIATRVGGIPEIIDWKYLVEPGDAGELAQRIENLVADRSARVECAKLNFENAKGFSSRTLDECRVRFAREFVQSISK